MKNIALGYCLQYYLKISQSSGGLVDKAVDSYPGGQGSIPHWVFCTFFKFFQTLRANCGFQRTRAIYRLCVSLKGGPEYPNKWLKSTYYCIFYVLVWYRKLQILGLKLDNFCHFHSLNDHKETF